MKKITLLVVLAAIVSVMANAQVTKETWIESHPVPHFPIPCIGDAASGDIYITHTIWKNADGIHIKHNAKITGVFVGNYGEYTLQKIVHDKNLGVPNLVGADYGYHLETALFRLNGKPFAVVHVMFHYTINANGEFTADFHNAVVNCH